ncbi:hypothetical protein D9M68_786420 [compost metagenome]
MNQNASQTAPSEAITRNAACQPQACRISGSMIGVSIAPTLVPALKMPVAMARSLAGNQMRVVLTHAG